MDLKRRLYLWRVSCVRLALVIGDRRQLAAGQIQTVVIGKCKSARKKTDLKIKGEHTI